MTDHPVCSLPTDAAQEVARILRDRDIGSVPVVADNSTMRLEGIINDRDLCCALLADGLDSRTPIGGFIARNPVIRTRRHRNLRACDAGAPGSKNSDSQRIRSLRRNRCSGRSGVE